jgi:hypothetical protein
VGFTGPREAVHDVGVIRNAPELERPALGVEVEQVDLLEVQVPLGLVRTVGRDLDDGRRMPVVCEDPVEIMWIVPPVACLNI